MSCGTSPLAMPLSGSLLVIERRANVSPGKLSPDTIFRETFCILWLIGTKPDGLPVIEQVGRVVSATVTVNEQLCPLVETQFTCVVPMGKNEPEAGVEVTVPQLPLVVGGG